MKFESFHCLSLHGIWAIIPWSTRMASVCVIFLGLFISYCSLVFHILGAFLKITIIPLALVGYEMIIANEAPRWLSIISYPVRAHEVLIIHDTMRKPDSIIVLLYIFHKIHPQKQKWRVQPFCFWGEHSKGLSNQVEVKLDMINAISVADIAFIMSSSQAIVNWLNALDQCDFS